MRTLVAVPVYNEQPYVQRVIDNITKYASDVLVVDDGSTDYTPMLLAMQKVDVIRHRVNQGYGRSIRDAFRWAQTYDYDWLITMDCDEQHEPESLPDFYEAMGRDDADVISGSRYLEDCPECNKPPADRQRINKTVTGWINDRLSLPITDAFCGYKAYRVSRLGDLDLNVDGYAIPLQAWVQHAAAGHRVKEVPIRLIYNDPNRSFGGPLDNPDCRLAHYTRVFEQELENQSPAFKMNASGRANGAAPAVADEPAPAGSCCG